MAIDSALKRRAVIGVARPWMRGAYPGTSGVSAAERAAIGNAYPVASFAVAAPSSQESTTKIVAPVIQKVINRIVSTIIN